MATARRAKWRQLDHEGLERKAHAHWLVHNKLPDMDERELATLKVSDLAGYEFPKDFIELVRSS